jgi:hypothetical protein
MKTKIRMLFFFLFMLVIQITNAKNIYVNDAVLTGDVYCTAIGNNTNSGLSASSPKLTLAAAITAATAGDVIYVDTGTWIVQNLDINKSVTIIGAGTGNTLFDGGNTQSNFATISVNNVKISNIQFFSYESALGNTSSIITVNTNITGIVISNILISKNGNHSGVGQSLVLQSGSEVTYNNSFTKCNGDVGGNGGGIIVNSATLTVNNCVFFNNTFTNGDGGAIQINGTSNVTINNSTFSDNKGQSGGAIAQRGGTLTVTGSCFTNNESTVANPEDGGGAVYVSGTITNCTFSNCAFSYNRAANSGVASGTPDGGSFKFHNAIGNASITNCSFSDGFKQLNGTVINGGLGQDIYYNNASLNITISNNSFSTANSGEVNIFEEGGGNQTMTNNGIYTQSGSTAATTNATPTRTDVAGFSTWTDINVSGTTVLGLLNGIVAFTPTRTANAGFGTWTDTDLGGSASLTLVNPTTTSYTPIRTAVSGFGTWTDTSITGTTTMIMLSNTSKIITPTLDLSTGSIKTISFSLGRSGTSATANVITTSISTDGGDTWTSLGTKSNNTSTPITQTIDISSYSSNNVKIRFESLGATGALGAILDDINILKRNTSTTITPTLDFTGHTTKTLNMQIAAVSSVAAPKNTITISGSTDNGATWTVLGTRVPTSVTLTATSALDLSSLSGSTVKLKFESLAADGTIGGQLDNIAITGEVKTSSIISPSLDLTGNTAQVSYLHTNIGTTAAKNTVTVSVSKDNGATWTSIGTSNSNGTKTFDLGTNLTSQVKVKFEALAADGTIGASVDDIAIVKAAAANAAPITSCTATTNITSCSAAAVVCTTETAPPVIFSCVPNKTAACGTTTLPDYRSEVSAYDDCSFEVIQSPAAGSALTGTTTVTMTVKDLKGNTTTCTFTVTVNSATWNGTEWIGTPSSSTPVTFTGDFSSTDHLNACSVWVTNDANVVINSNHNFTVQNAVTVDSGSTFTFDNNANLVQVNNVSNSGNIIMKRDTNLLKRLDYTIWSAPVAGQNLLAFSPSTLTNRFYTYNTATDAHSAVNPSSTSFATGLGYQIRVPNDHPISTPTTWTGTFTGVPNNGPYNVTISSAGNRYNMVGNPYPSPIDLTTFSTVNTSNIEGTIWFWRKENSIVTQGVWTTWNAGTFVTIKSSSNPVSIGIDHTNFDDVAKNGQGFLVKGKEGITTLSFTNAMRVTNTSDQFFRTNNSNLNRIWLNLTSASGHFSQQAIRYSEGGTNDIDRMDAENINSSDVLFTSLRSNVATETNKFTIQSRQYPFDVNDVVPLSVKVSTAGTYSIAIHKKDGLFQDGTQAIYLKDNLTNTETNLNNGSYSFVSDAGVFDARFELKYVESALSNNQNNFENNVIVYQQNEIIHVNSSIEPIQNVKIFDIRGRLVHTADNINATSTNIKLNIENQVVLMRITLINGAVITRKILN